jgi:polyisoprenoid-binding protein YceI
MRNLIRIPVLLFLGVLALTACGLLREPEEASAPIEAIPLEETATALPEVEPTAEQAPSAEPDAYPPPAEGSEAVAAYPPALEEDSTSAYPAAANPGSGGLRVYVISQADSEVRFEIDEDLRGQRNTVVGVTDQVAGEIAVDLADLASTQVGTIQINGRTLVTDNNFRNRAIQNEILDTGDYEFMTFTPTAIEGLPDSVAVGEEVQFVVSGDLEIRDTSNPVQFTVVATAVSEDQLVGTASATVLRTDYGLQIPSVPNVANVEDEVELYIDFVANAQ